MTDRERFVLLRDDREDRTVVFAEPIAVVTVRDRAGFEPAFAALQAAQTADGRGLRDWSEALYGPLWRALGGAHRGQAGAEEEVA